MVAFRRKTRLRVAAVACGIGLVAASAGGALAAAIPDDNDLSAAQEEKLANAWVDPKQDLQFGAKPLEWVQQSSANAAANASCEISAESATAMVIAMTWPETSPSGESPSPMTLSRYDTQSTLGDPEGRAEGLWFHPGIGVWQLDSAGLGNDYTAGEAMDTKYASKRMAPHIVNEYCDNINGGASEADARRAAWQPWVACWEGACEDTYQRALAGVTPVEEVKRFGGTEVRDCEVGGEEVRCHFVDPANAQGTNWWAAPDGGNSPIAAPFYVWRQTDGDAVTEVRYWLAEDSGAAVNVMASRPFGTNARDSLTWTEGSGFCDVRYGRGDACAAE